MVLITRGLLEALLDMAASAEPEGVTVVISGTPAGGFEADLGVDPETPVLTHFYLPEAAESVTAVFGMDLGTPAGRGRARFVSHPQGPRRPTERDDHAAVVVVAVPPWEAASVRAYDRGGSRVELTVVDAEPPRETLAD